MEVTFTKAPGRRYYMSVERAHGPALAPRQGPGYDEYLPHDAVHFIVEDEAGLTGAVFGRIAAGRSNFFTPADPKTRRRVARREARRAPPTEQRAEMAQSEDLASLCLVLWQIRNGHRTERPPWFSRLHPAAVDSPLITRILERLDAFAAEWHALPVGAGIKLRWERGSARRRRRDHARWTAAGSPTYERTSAARSSAIRGLPSSHPPATHRSE